MDKKWMILVLAVLVIGFLAYYYSGNKMINDSIENNVNDVNIPDNLEANDIPSPIDNPVVPETTNDNPMNDSNSVERIKIFSGNTETIQFNGYPYNITLLDVKDTFTASIRIGAETRYVRNGSVYGVPNIGAELEVKNVFYDANDGSKSFIVIMLS